MTIMLIGILVACLCWMQHVKEQRKRISWQTFIANMKKLERNGK